MTTTYGTLKLLLAVALFFSFYLTMIVSVCAEFYYLPGFDRCAVKDYPALLLFFLLAILPFFFISKASEPAVTLVWQVYLFHVLSAVALLPVFAVGRSYWEKIIFALLVLTSYFVISLTSRVKFIVIRSPPISSRILSLGLLLLCVLVVFVFVSSFPFTLRLPSIFDVYGVRNEFKEALQDGVGRSVSYAMLIGTYSISPSAVVISLAFWSRQPILSFLLLIAAFAVSIVVYSAAAFKSVAMMPVFVFILFFIFRRSESFFHVYLRIFSVIFVFGWVLYIFSLDGNLFIHWLRRIFMTPGMNVSFYFEHYGFFSIGQAVVAPSHIMSIYYNSIGSANSGLFGSALALAGVFGIILNALLFCCFIVLVGIAFRGISWKIAAPALFPFAYAASNSALSTSFVSYGGVVTLFIFFVARHALLSSEYALGVKK